MRTLVAALLLAISGSAADWLMSRADPQGTGWQQHGKSIGADNVQGLKLLWKRTLDNQSRGLNSLTAPTILGPIVTHRGIKELVFVGGSSNNIYAVDADLGRVFWKRHIDSEPGQGPCDGGLTAAPAFAPPPPGTRVREESDEGASPMRPFYFVASDGILHTIRPSDGIDMAPARKFVPANANLSALRLSKEHVYATTSNGCGGVPDGLWGVDVGNPNAKAGFFGAKNAAVSLGVDGNLFVALNGKIVTLEQGNLSINRSLTVAARNADFGWVAPIAFKWKGRDMLVGAGRDRLLLVDGGRVSEVAAGAIAGLATWVDDGGTRWVYAAMSDGIQAFRLVETAGKAILEPDWIAQKIRLPLEPVIVNGIVLALARGDASTHAVLYALDAHTGKQRYSSGDAVTSFVTSSGLGVANGHVFFGTADNTLYCFGFPIEIE